MAAEKLLVIVDDDPVFCRKFVSLLKRRKYHVDVFESGNAVLDHLRQYPQAGIMLLDLQTREVDGVSIIRELRSIDPHPATIVIANQANLQVAFECLKAGAEDYIAKPFDLEFLLFTLERVRQRLQLRDRERQSSELLARYTKLYADYKRMTLGAIASLAKMVSYDHEATSQHARRTEKYLLATLNKLGVGERDRDLISFAMRLHDIGKIRVPKKILNKPGPLTDEEWEIVRMHPVWGYNILHSDGLLREIAPLVRSHHERWDGKGYPDGISGTSIPLGARVMTVIDSFDAMCSHRSYRPSMPIHQALTEIRAEAGKQFDPEIVEVFTSTIRLESGGSRGVSSDTHHDARGHRGSGGSASPWETGSDCHDS